jgi:hypothetical protein
MKNKEDKNLENLVEKMMKENSLETPSFDFTSKVMSDVFSLEKKKSFSYKPVISKRGWLIIFAAIGSLITWIIFNVSENETSSNFDFSFLNAEKIFKIFSGFQFSGITTNIILLAMAMMFIQILFLNSYLNKKFHK